VGEGNPNIRLFVGIQPPEDMRRLYLDALTTLSPPPDSRRRDVPPEQVHLTLQFIGGIPERELEAVVESVERSAAGLPPFALTPLQLVSFPERGTPRLIALELGGPPTLLEVRRRLVQRLAHRPRREDPNRFTPHITLTRFKPDAHPAKVRHPVTLPGFEVRDIVLFRSHLKPTGAVYSRVTVAALEG
jgi:2'-5' RNA ligase